MIESSIKNILEDLSSLIIETHDIKINKQLSKILTINKEKLIDVAKKILKNYNARLVHEISIDLGIDGFKIMQLYELLDKEGKPYYHIGIESYFSREESKVPSLAAITYQANWAEREAMELLGIEFEGHPDKRHLFLPYEWPNEVEAGIEEAKKIGFNVFPRPEPPNILPIGPYHPALLEGVFLRLKIDGETIVDADLKPGFNHRGIMKLGEERSYWRNLYLFERVCGICSADHTNAYVLAVENLFNIEPPDRAKYIRTLGIELERIASHLLWLGIAGDLIGFKTFFMWCWREREKAIDLLERLAGNRVTKGIARFGGAKRDLKKEEIDKMIEKLEDIKKNVEKLIDIAYNNSILRKRTEDIGILDFSNAIELGAVGPVARASNWKIDVRHDCPFDAYSPEYTTWDVITDNGKDVWARVIVRAREILVAIDICNQCLNALKEIEGEIITSEKYEINKGEGVGKVEAPRGELVYYLMSNGEPIPYCVRIRTPSYRNNAVVPFILKGYKISDAPIIYGSVDPCMSCTDRVQIIDVKTGEKKNVTLNDLVKGVNK
ncbi:MAG: NADH-quinone oxidoreductase subunit C [Nitrososphaerota archaeon]